MNFTPFIKRWLAKGLKVSEAIILARLKAKENKLRWTPKVDTQFNAEWNTVVKAAKAAARKAKLDANPPTPTPATPTPSRIRVSVKPKTPKPPTINGIEVLTPTPAKEQRILVRVTLDSLMKYLAGSKILGFIARREKDFAPLSASGLYSLSLLAVGASEKDGAVLTITKRGTQDHLTAHWRPVLKNWEIEESVGFKCKVAVVSDTTVVNSIVRYAKPTKEVVATKKGGALKEMCVSLGTTARNAIQESIIGGGLDDKGVVQSEKLGTLRVANETYVMGKVRAAIAVKTKELLTKYGVEYEDKLSPFSERIIRYAEKTTTKVLAKLNQGDLQKIVFNSRAVYGAPKEKRFEELKKEIEAVKWDDPKVAAKFKVGKVSPLATVTLPPLSPTDSAGKKLSIKQQKLQQQKEFQELQEQQKQRRLTYKRALAESMLKKYSEMFDGADFLDKKGTNLFALIDEHGVELDPISLKKFRERELILHDKNGVPLDKKVRDELDRKHKERGPGLWDYLSNLILMEEKFKFFTWALKVMKRKMASYNPVTTPLNDVDENGIGYKSQRDERNRKFSEKRFKQRLLQLKDIKLQHMERVIIELVGLAIAVLTKNLLDVVQIEADKRREDEINLINVPKLKTSKADTPAPTAAPVSARRVAVNTERVGSVRQILTDLAYELSKVPVTRESPLMQYRTVKVDDVETQVVTKAPPIMLSWLTNIKVHGSDVFLSVSDMQLSDVLPALLKIGFIEESVERNKGEIVEQHILKRNNLTVKVTHVDANSASAYKGVTISV
jgi:hypothetical protein